MKKTTLRRKTMPLTGGSRNQKVRVASPGRRVVARSQGARVAVMRGTSCTVETSSQRPAAPHLMMHLAAVLACVPLSVGGLSRASTASSRHIPALRWTARLSRTDDGLHRVAAKLSPNGLSPGGVMDGGLSQAIAMSTGFCVGDRTRMPGPPRARALTAVLFCSSSIASPCSCSPSEGRL